MTPLQTVAQALGIAAALAAGALMLLSIGLVVAMLLARETDDEGIPALGCALGAIFWAVIAAACLAIARS